VTGTLGKGAMGVVYLGYDPVINRPVAIKTIHKSLLGQDLSGSSTTARFRNEAQAVGRLSHPGIVAIYEYGEDENSAYIAMEYVQGRTLSQILGNTPRVPEADILLIMDQLLAALECAHRHGVWHRDIKPANLLITDNGVLKVTDFGIARIESVVLTQITSTIGTPGYMAPEQYVGERVDHRVDIFACGVLLYGMLVGRPPFQGSPETVMYKVMHDEPVAPSKVPEAARPDFYDAIVARAMAKDPALRYQTVSEFRSALAKRVIPPPDDASETTVIIVRPGEAPPPPAAGVRTGTGSHTSASEPASRPTSSLSGWDPGTLAQIELALASFVGPMAKVMVRQAAKTCSDLPALKAAISEHLQSDQDRQRFMAKFEAVTAPARVTGGKTSTAPGVSAAASGSHASGSKATQAELLSAEMIAHGQKVLTKHMGPIATVVVKKSGAKAKTLAEFFELLAEQVAEGPERERVLAELRRKP
ncbi:MAG TPA: serine/threonine-protein kinase, partial [Rhizobacter sp.]|nr:serine/threonine-protein kinase [Rhizobacter sp.]